MNINKENLDALLSKNLITYSAYCKMLGEIAPIDWKDWALKNLLVLGALLALSGVVFFFAYNWFLIPAWSKLGACILLFGAAAGAAYKKGLDGMAGTVLSFLTCFLIGAFLAVFGQVYQTGANAWQLFLAWAALMLPLAFVAHKSAIWVLFIVLLNTVVFLNAAYAPFYALCAVNIPLFIVACLPFDVFKQEKYFYYLLGTYITIFLTCFAMPHCGNIMHISTFLLWVLAMGVYYFKNKNLYFVGVNALAFGVFIFAQANVHILQTMWVANAVFALLLSGGLGYFLLWAHKRFKGVKHDA
ncbi:putative membrane protein [Elusimicrobium simillimum]|uniref:DUF2157 domain-containing protein n=1 Tax=Elusimicrobium simillimum TaxID=3143438 RepID=UPI003C6F4965